MKIWGPPYPASEQTLTSEKSRSRHNDQGCAEFLLKKAEAEDGTEDLKNGRKPEYHTRKRKRHIFAIS